MTVRYNAKQMAVVTCEFSTSRDRKGAGCVNRSLAVAAR